MKKIILSVFFLLISLSLNAQNLDDLDKDNGFAGIKLGTPRDTTIQWRKWGKFQFKDIYTKVTETVKIENLKKIEITYYYYKNELHSFMIKVDGDDAAEAMLGILQIYYGFGEQDGFAPRYTWKGKYVNILYDKNMLSRNTEVTFESNPIQSKLQKDVVEKYKY